MHGLALFGTAEFDTANGVGKDGPGCLESFAGVVVA